jgi:hypothetical protein
MRQISATPRSSDQADDKNAIRPFHANVPDAELTELRRRINATKWPERETVPDASQGPWRQSKEPKAPKRKTLEVLREMSGIHSR